MNDEPRDDVLPLLDDDDAASPFVSLPSFVIEQRR